MATYPSSDSPIGYTLTDEHPDSPIDYVLTPAGLRAATRPAVGHHEAARGVPGALRVMENFGSVELENLQ